MECEQNKKSTLTLNVTEFIFGSAMYKDYEVHLNFALVRTNFN